MRRFFAEPHSFSDGSVVLDAEEAKHARDVLRLRTGDEIAVFDGCGNEYSARLKELSKNRATAQVIEKLEPSAPESPVAISLASVAIPGEKYDLIVQKAVELGVVRFIPLYSVRSEIKLKDLFKKFDRWRRIALHAAKQCGRATLMSIEDPRDVKEILAAVGAEQAKIFFSERDGSSLPEVANPSSMTVVIGPKGGWDDSEIELAASHGFSIVTLGGRIMRAETAAIALTAILQHRFGDIN
jgi:16S rRNA (uracil1498-N3)-methyltransferase